MKVLITYFSTGMGHKSPALAIAEALRPSCEVDVLDCADLGIPDVEKSLLGFWNFSLAHPKLLKLLYFVSDNRPVARFGLWLHAGKIAAKIKPYIERTKPDIIVSTHMTSAAGIAKAGYPVKVVTTEPFNVHALWAVCGASEYFVPTTPVRRQLEGLGVKVPIKVLGFPLNPKFTKLTRSISAIRKELGFRQGRISVLITGGGEGISNTEDILRALISSRADIDIIAVCGKNKELFQRLDRIRCDKPRLVVKGFVNNMNELISAVDMVAGKTGANTALEALVLNKPFCCTHVMTNEEPLCDYIVRNGYGWKTITVGAFMKLIEEIVAHREVLRQAQRNVKSSKIMSGASAIAKHLCRES